MGRHCVYPVIGEHLNMPNGIWKPADFVDQCEAANLQSSDPIVLSRLNAVAVAEWQALFQYCISPR